MAIKNDSKVPENLKNALDRILELENKVNELKAQNKREEMAKTVYKTYIELTEEVYGIKGIKNLKAK